MIVAKPHLTPRGRRHLRKSSSSRRHPPPQIQPATILIVARSLARLHTALGRAARCLRESRRRHSTRTPHSFSSGARARRGVLGLPCRQARGGRRRPVGPRARRDHSAPGRCDGSVTESMVSCM
jgi:hypothetical protein